MPPAIRYLKPFLDVFLTIVFWTYFTLGFVVFFSPFYLLAAVLSKDPEASFQRLNRLFYRGFFFLVRTLTPGVDIRIEKDVKSLRSSVIVCNHASYLDPILLISLFEKQKTIVKSVFFKIPVFSWVLRTSGYLPSDAGDLTDGEALTQLSTLERFLSGGGNLFVFPEGTRSRTGRIAPFSAGAFKIARRCHAPVQVLFIRNTDRLFRPGKFLFNTCVPLLIRVEKIGELTMDPQKPREAIRAASRSVAEMMAAYSEKIRGGDIP